MRSIATVLVLGIRNTHPVEITILLKQVSAWLKRLSFAATRESRKCMNYFRHLQLHYSRHLQLNYRNTYSWTKVGTYSWKMVGTYSWTKVGAYSWTIGIQISLLLAPFCFISLLWKNEASLHSAELIFWILFAFLFKVFVIKYSKFAIVCLAQADLI